MKQKETNKNEENALKLDERVIPISTTPTKLVDLLSKYNKKFYPDVEVMRYSDDTILIRTPELPSNPEGVYAFLKAEKEGINTLYLGKKTNYYLLGFWSCASEGRI